MNIKVTRKDIKTGIVKACFACPISLAIDRHLPPGLKSYVVTDSFAIITTTEGQAKDFTKPQSDRFVILPKRAREFVPRFDMGAKFQKPFSFNLSAECFML